VRRRARASLAQALVWIKRAVAELEKYLARYAAEPWCAPCFVLCAVCRALCAGWRCDRVRAPSNRAVPRAKREAARASAATQNQLLLVELLFLVGVMCRKLGAR
jgi:hypothetical protein